MLIWLFCFSVIFAEAQVNSVPNLPDSVHVSIRLKARLLINPEEISTVQIDSLQQKQIPIAFLYSGEKSLPYLSETNQPVILVYPDGLPNARQNRNAISLSGKEMDKILIPADAESLQDMHSFRELLWMKDNQDSLPPIDYFMNFWKRTGRLPNFIEVSSRNLAKAVELVAALNNQQKLFGVVRNGERLLADVSWKDYPDRNTNGYFSFPVSFASDFPLSPYKSGYQFSPDIILPSPENLNNLKVFNAVPLDSDFGLTDDFVFANRVSNLKRENDDEIISNGLKFVRDKTRGKCALFSGKAYIDGGLRSRSALKPNFSVTAWIKPARLGHNNCILGKGKDFVLKIHDGLLTFTVQGIKDYFSAQTQIPVDQWSFVGLVHNATDNQISFYLNGELTESVNLITPYTESDNTLLIGSNLWEEFFVGRISEIKIWNRELNKEEIKNEFLFSGSTGKYISARWIVGIFVLLIAVALVIRFRLRRKAKLDSNSEIRTGYNFSEPNSLPAIPDSRERIQCFGGLKVINPEGKDVSLKFSPKLRQLFVLIFLHSVAGQKGISSKKMSDCLWPGMNPQNAKNIRGTNIQNLKAILASCSGINLIFQDKLWKLEFAANYFADYDLVLSTLNRVGASGNPIDPDQIQVLVPILKNGALFPNIRESWLDPYIDRMSNRIIEFGLNLFSTIPEGKQDALLLDVAEIITINDQLNEPALRKKVGILTRQGKLSLAHTVFDNFVKLYFELYREKYPGDFKSFVSGENEIPDQFVQN